MQKPALEQDSDLCSPRLTTISSLFFNAATIFLPLSKIWVHPMQSNWLHKWEERVGKTPFFLMLTPRLLQLLHLLFFCCLQQHWSCRIGTLVGKKYQLRYSAISYLKAWAIFHGSCRRKVNIYCTQDVIISPSSCGCTRQWPPPTHGAHTHRG